MLQRAKWALGEDELKRLEERAKYFDLDKSKDFQTYKKVYLGRKELRYTLDNQFFSSNTLPGKKEFISKLTERWDEINNIGKSQTKYEWIDTLGKFGFKD